MTVEDQLPCVGQVGVGHCTGGQVSVPPCAQGTVLTVKGHQPSVVQVKSQNPCGDFGGKVQRYQGF